MQWPLPWLEALGLLAIVFAAGNGIGFSISRLIGRQKTPRQKAIQTTPAPSPRVKPAPVEVEAAAPSPPSPVEPVAAAEMPVPEATVTQAVAPAPALLTQAQAAFSLRVRYSVNPFGGLSETRPNLDQSSN